VRTCDGCVRQRNNVIGVSTRKCECVFLTYECQISKFSCVQPIVFGVSFNFKFQLQSHGSLCSETWQQRLTEGDHQLRLEDEETTPQLDGIVYTNIYS